MYYTSLPFRKDDSVPLPRLRLKSLAEGLTLTSFNWLLFGVGLWAVLQGTLKEPPPWSWEAWGRFIAYMGVAYVAGFVIPVPGGLGVREVLLTFFLLHELTGPLQAEGDMPRATVELAVVVLRLVWTTAEVLAAGILYLLPARGFSSAQYTVQQDIR